MSYRPTHTCKNPICRTFATPQLQRFRHDEGRGDVTCVNCGRVAEDRTPHQTEEKLTFAESDVSKSRTQAVNEYTEDISTTVAETRSSDPLVAHGNAILARRTKVQFLWEISTSDSSVGTRSKNEGVVASQKINQRIC